MKTRIVVLVLATLGLCLADTVTLRSGRTVEGTFLGGDARQIRVAVGDRVETFDIADVSTVQFGATAKPAESAPPRARLEPEPAAAAPAAAAPAAPVPASGEIPAGTNLVVRMIDDVDSQVHRVGQTFRASLDEPVEVNGVVLVPKGADVTARLIEDKESGKLTGRAELTMDLVSLNAGGRTVALSTQTVTTASESRTGQTAKVVGGTAALGAIIGAIAGGGRGAAAGAAAGAGAGTAVQVLTKGQRVRIPSESRLQFTLEKPVRL